MFYFDRKEWTESALLVNLHELRLNGTFDKNAVMSSRLHREIEKRGEMRPNLRYIPHLLHDQYVVALPSNINEQDVLAPNVNQHNCSSKPLLSGVNSERVYLINLQNYFKW